MALWGLGTCRTRMSALLRSWKKPRFLPAETKLMSDKRAGARLVDRRPTRRVPTREGEAQKAPQATFSNELVYVPRIIVTSGEPAGIGPDICVMLARTDWRAALGGAGGASVL